jgi:hypothetical protein
MIDLGASPGILLTPDRSDTGSVPPGPVGRRHTVPVRRITKELVIVAVFVTGYELLRVDMVQDGAQAAAHALAVVRVESAVGLFHEAAIQRLFLHLPPLVTGCNLYYGGTHFVVPIAALVWLAVRHPERYARARTTLATTTAAAFAVFWLFPVAPPRLLPARYGIVDTLVTFHQSGHLEHSLVDSAGDVYAAMPSLHVAWALWCSLALYPVIRHRALRALVVVYPVVTTLVVLVTGNHFITDAVSGAVLVSVVWLLIRLAGSRRPTRAHRVPTPTSAHRAARHLFGDTRRDSDRPDAIPLPHPEHDDIGVDLHHRERTPCW